MARPTLFASSRPSDVGHDPCRRHPEKECRSIYGEGRVIHAGEPNAKHGIGRPCRCTQSEDLRAREDSFSTPINGVIHTAASEGTREPTSLPHKRQHAPPRTSIHDTTVTFFLTLLTTSICHVDRQLVLGRSQPTRPPS